MCVPMLAWLSALELWRALGVVSLTLTVAVQRSSRFLYLIYIPNASSPNVSIWKNSCPLSKVRNRAKKRGVKVEEKPQMVKEGSQLELKVDLLTTFRCHDHPPCRQSQKKAEGLFSVTKSENVSHTLCGREAVTSPTEAAGSCSFWSSSGFQSANLRCFHAAQPSALHTEAPL